MSRQPATPLRPRRRTRRAAFTIVELLVVVAILSVLIAILFPALQRARRKALVLASPIAFIGTDNRLHLTDPSGQADLPLVLKTQNSCPVCHVPPVWSPSGQELAFRLVDPGNYTAVLDPMNDQVRKFSVVGGLIGWVDSRHVAESDRSTLYVRDTDSGQVVQRVVMDGEIFFLFPAPPNSPGPFIGGIRRGRVDVICFLNKGFGPARPVHQQPATQNRFSMESPRVDPMGEFVAFTMHGQGAGGSGSAVGIKAIGELAARPATAIGRAAGYAGAYFCDWTDQGQLLCNVSKDGSQWQLAIFDRNARLVRMLGTPVPPAKGVVASWRHYGHR